MMTIPCLFNINLKCKTEISIVTWQEYYSRVHQKNILTFYNMIGSYIIYIYIYISTAEETHIQQNDDDNNPQYGKETALDYEGSVYTIHSYMQMLWNIHMRPRRRCNG